MARRKEYVTLFGDLRIIHIQTPLLEQFWHQAPTGITVIGRMRYLMTNDNMNAIDTLNLVAEELIYIWCYGLNIYPITRKKLILKLDQLYFGEKKPKKGSETKGFRQLLNWPKGKRNPNWEKRVKEMSEMLQTGFDIKTNVASRIKILEEVYSVKMTEEESNIYEDNCKVKTCSCAWDIPLKCQDCPRQMYSTNVIDKLWQKRKIRRLQQMQYLDNQRENQKVLESRDLHNEHIADIENLEFNTSPVDDDFAAPEHLKECIESVRTNLCSSEIMKSSEHTSTFPKVPLRYSKANLNPKVMRAVVYCLATYKVSDNDLEGIIVDIANMIFDQSLVKCEEGTFDVKETNSDSEDDTEHHKRKLEDCEESDIPSAN